MIISQKISSYIADTLADNNTISRQEVSIYSYCLDYIIELILLFVFAVIFGFCTNNIPETIIFLIVFIPIRSFGGGFHATTQKRCTVISLLTFLFVLYSDKIVTIFMNEWTVAFTISLLGIAFLSPVGTKNRPMSPERKTILKKRCILFCFFLALLYLFFYIQKSQKIYGILAICVLINFVSIFYGCILEKKNTDKNVTERMEKL